MIFDGQFLNLENLEFTDSSDTEKSMLKSVGNNLMHQRLSYFKSSDLVSYKVDKLLEFEEVLNSDLYDKWEHLLEELDIAHQMYLYAMGDTKITVDVKCAFLIELFVILMTRHLKNQMIKRKINRNLRAPYPRKCRNL